MVESDLNDTVYEVLDSVFARGSIPPGAKGLMFRVVDDLRARPDICGKTALAERISLQIHRIEDLLRLQDREAVDAALEQLKQLAAEWIEARVFNSKRGSQNRLVKLHPLTVA